MQNKTRLIIIYLPNGEEAKYSGDYKIAETIECDPGLVKIALKEDEKIVGHAYTGMPYYLEMF